MKLKDSFINYKMNDENVLVTVDNQIFSGIVHLNKVSAFIADCLKEDISEEKLINAILNKYDVDRKTAVTDVQNVIKQLKSIGAIDE